MQKNNNFILIKYFLEKQYGNLGDIILNYILNIFQYFKKNKHFQFEIGLKFNFSNGFWILDKLELYTSIDFLVLLYKKRFININNNLYLKLVNISKGYINKNFYISIDIKKELINFDVLKIKKIDYYFSKDITNGRIENKYDLLNNTLENKYIVFYNNIKRDFFRKLGFEDEYYLPIKYKELIFGYKKNNKAIYYGGLNFYDISFLLNKYLFFYKKENIGKKGNYVFGFSLRNGVISEISLVCNFL